MKRMKRRSFIKLITATVATPVVSTVLAKTKPIHEIADSPTYDKIITNCVAYDTNPKIVSSKDGVSASDGSIWISGGTNS